MTQKWYLRNTTAANPPTTGEKSTAIPGARTLGANQATSTDETRSLDAAKGAAQTSLTKAGDASTAERMNYLARFTSPPLAAGTLLGLGNWTMAMAMNESNANANSFLNFSIYFWRPGTSSVVGFVYDSLTDVGTEWANAETGEVNTIVGVGVTIQEGDVLVLEVWRHCTTQGMATAYNQIVYFEGTTDPTDGTATSDAAAYINAPADIPLAPSQVTQTWNLRHDLVNSVEQIWNLRHDLSNAVTNTWNLRHDLSAKIEQIWNLRHDLSSKIEQVWNLRHDLLSSISQIWTFRHDLVVGEIETPVVVENPVRGFKTRNRPQFFMPLTKAITVKFRIPIYWVNKLDIKLDLPVYYDVIYEKVLPLSYSSNTMVRLRTSTVKEIKLKINTFLENIQNISLKPDYRLEKVKNLSKLRKLLNTLNEVD